MVPYSETCDDPSKLTKLNVKSMIRLSHQDKRETDKRVFDQFSMDKIKFETL